MTAPVCKINPAAEPILPRPITPMAIPIATDLQSLIQAVNAMRQILLNLNIPSNNTGTNGGGFIANNPNGNPNKQANFQEVVQKRVTQKIRVFNANDKTQYVDVQQITGLTFVDPANGQTINWSQ